MVPGDLGQDNQGIKSFTSIQMDYLFEVARELVEHKHYQDVLEAFSNWPVGNYQAKPVHLNGPMHMRRSIEAYEQARSCNS